MGEKTKNKNVDTELVTSCLNINTLLKYLKRHYGDISPLLRGFEVTEEYLSDPNNWISKGTDKRLFYRTKDFTGNRDPRLFFDIGRETANLESLGALEQLVRLYPNPRVVVERIPHYNKKFNNLFEMEVYDIESKSAKIDIHWRSDFREEYIYDECPWNLGIIATIPRIWGLPDMEIIEKQCIFNLDEIVNDSYGYLGLKTRFENGRFYVDDEEYAHEVFSEDGNESLGYVATRDLIVGDTHVLTEGVIYGATCCTAELHWENKSIVRNLYDLTLGRVKQWLASREALEKQLDYSRQQFFEIQRLNRELQGYATTLEQKVKERTEELEEANTKLRDQEVTELLGDVMGWVRHSLGQPMMALVGYIKGLQGSEIKYAESKQQMYDAAQELSSRISSLHGEIEKTPRGEESYRNILTAFDKDILEPTVQLMRASKYLGEEYDPAFQKDIGGATQVITQIRGLVSNLEKFVRREDPANMALIPLRDYVTQYVKVYSQGTFQDGLPYGLQENSIVIEIDIPEDLTVYSAKGVLDDIFYNPLQNCIDHAFLDKEKDVEGRIGIKGYSITEGGIDKTIIEISDNGCGMSEDTLKNIFKPQVTAKKIGMGGLGAASLKRWVLWHRYGSVEYESEPGRGTLVRIALPSREYE